MMCFNFFFTRVKLGLNTVKFYNEVDRVGVIDHEGVLEFDMDWLNVIVELEVVERVNDGEKVNT